MSALANRKQSLTPVEEMRAADGEALKKRNKALRDQYALILKEPIPPNIIALISRMRMIELAKNS